MSFLTRKSPQILDDFGQRRKPPLIVSQSELRGAFLAGIALIPTSRFTKEVSKEYIIIEIYIRK